MAVLPSLVQGHGVRRLRMAGGGGGDTLQARLAVQRELALARWQPTGLPSTAVLLVRQMRLAAASRGLASDVDAALQAQAAQATRPWLQPDAAAAPAVWFHDDTELAACLVRDLLRGVWAQAWWWPCLLRGATPEGWLQREVLPHGQRLLPTLVLLDRQTLAAAWVSHWSPAIAAMAWQGIAMAYALPSPAASPAPAAAAMRGADQPGLDAIEPAVEGPGAALLAWVPDRQAATWTANQRWVLAATRAAAAGPGGLRQPAFVQALAGMPPTATVASVQRPRPAQPVSTPVQRAVPEDATLPIATPPPAPAAIKNDQAGPEVAEGSQIQQPAPASARPKPQAMPAVVGPHPACAASQPSAIKNSPAVAHAAATGKVPPRAEQPSPAATPVRADLLHQSPSDPAAAQALLAEPAARQHDSEPEWHTSQLGGLFYLLNAALATGLYGDFTAPRHPGLALSPWDWLALIGQAWFGDEFLDDGACAVLATLAGRDSDQDNDQAPGADAPVPEDAPDWPAWIAVHLPALQDRIARALGCDAPDVPALLCRQAARIVCTDTRLDIHLALAALPLPVRFAGLDRDPGWIPAAGRSVAFHFTA